MSWSISTTLKEHEKTDAKLQEEWDELRALVPSGNDHCPAERDEQVMAVEKALFDLLSDYGIFDHAQELDRLAVDAGLLLHLLHGDLRRRVADVGPPGRVEPDTGVGPLDEQDPPVVVADDRTDRDLRCDVPQLLG